MRGHVDLKGLFWIWAILAVVGAEAFFRYRDGRSPLADYWVPIAIGAGALVVAMLLLGAWHRWRKRPRIERRDGRALIHFDGEVFEVVPGEFETNTWSSGGAFGQPLVCYMSLSRGGQVIYQGTQPDAERLLAAFRQASK